MESSRVVEDPELLRLAALFSFLDFRPLREKIDPNICTLSGLSDRIEGILLAFERPEDLLDKLTTLSVEPEIERNEEEAEEMVLVLELFPNRLLLFICSWKARILSGEGGPSIHTAGSRESGDSCRGGEESFLDDVFFPCVTV